MDNIEPIIPDEEARELVEAFRDHWPNWGTFGFSAFYHQILRRIALRLKEQDEPEIERCGVCGDVEPSLVEDRGRFWVYSGCECDFSGPSRKTKSDAIRFWNAAQRAVREG